MLQVIIKTKPCDECGKPMVITDENDCWCPACTVEIVGAQWRRKLAKEAK